MTSPHPTQTNANNPTPALDTATDTADWVGWFNTQRIHTEIGDIPPREHETNYYAHNQPHTEADTNN